MNQSYKFLTNTSLKIIAMIIMIIDHSAWLIDDVSTNLNLFSSNHITNIMHMVGRIGFPIFLFCISEGYRNTRNLNLYIRKVGFLAVASIIPFALFFGQRIGFLFPQNTVFTLFFGLCALHFSDKVDNKLSKMLIVLLFFILSLPCDGGIGGGVFAIYAFGKIKDFKLRTITGAFAMNYFLFVVYILDRSLENLVELALTLIPFLILMVFYNGNKGSGTRKFFYYFYPAHLLFLGIIQYFM